MGVSPAAVEGVESRAQRPRAGREGAFRPLLALFPRPARAAGAPSDRAGRVETPRLPGAHALGPRPRRAWPLRPGRVKARPTTTAQIVRCAPDWCGWRLRLRGAALTRPALRGAGQSTIATRVTG